MIDNTGSRRSFFSIYLPETMSRNANFCLNIEFLPGPLTARGRESGLFLAPRRDPSSLNMGSDAF